MEAAPVSAPPAASEPAPVPSEPAPAQPAQPEKIPATAEPAANGHHHAEATAPAQVPAAAPAVPVAPHAPVDGQQPPAPPQQHPSVDGQQQQQQQPQQPTQPAADGQQQHQLQQQQGQYDHQQGQQNQQYDHSASGGSSYRRPAPDDSLPELRILLHNHDVGPVIGRNGQNVSRMRTECGVYASVLKVRDSRGTPDRVMTIRGEPPNIASSLRILAEVLLSAAMEAEAKGIPIPFEPGKTVVRILAQNAVCGSVIGHGGEIVKSIETETEARVKVGSDFLPRSTEKIVSISGTPEAIGKAAHRVVAQLFQKPVRRIPGEQIPYSPDYGGYERYHERDRGRFGGPRRDRDFRDRDYDRRPGPASFSDRERDFARDSGALPPPPAGEAGSSSSSSGDAPPPAFMPVPGTAGYEEGKVGAGAGAGGPLAKQEVSIPSSLTGAVIGRGGGIIRSIQENYDHKNPKERIATITGPASQIPLAVQLIRDAVDDGARVARSPPRDRDRDRGDRPYRGYDRDRDRERDYDRDRDRYYDRDGRRGPPRYRSRSPPPRHPPPHMAGPPPPHPYAMPPPHGYYPPPAHASPAVMMPYPSQPVYMPAQPPPQQQAPYGYAYAPAPAAAPAPTAAATGAPAATMSSHYPTYATAPAPTAQAPPPQQQAYAYAPYGYAPQ